MQQINRQLTDRDPKTQYNNNKKTWLVVAQKIKIAVAELTSTSQSSIKSVSKNIYKEEKQ